MNIIKTKKKLGQHFLKDKNIAKKIVDSLKLKNYNRVLEIGPGKGVLTDFILKKSTIGCQEKAPIISKLAIFDKL